jgi:hypothetical protein
MNRDLAKKQIEESSGKGWFNLIDIIFDNKPKDVEITEVFQKWAGLKVDYNGENEDFNYLLDRIYYISQKMCEVCGLSGGYTIIDGWETTLCNEHFNASTAKNKYRELL